MDADVPQAGRALVAAPATGDRRPITGCWPPRAAMLMPDQERWIAMIEDNLSELQ